MHFLNKLKTDATHVSLSNYHNLGNTQHLAVCVIVEEPTVIFAVTFSQALTG